MCNSTQIVRNADAQKEYDVWNVAKRQLFPTPRTANTDSGTAVSLLGIANTDVG